MCITGAENIDHVEGTMMSEYAGLAEQCNLEPSCEPISFCGSDGFFADPSQTLLFLDWDDTLFPTTEIFDRWGLPYGKDTPTSAGRALTSEEDASLATWRDALYEYLSAACRVSERCVILTNTRRPWVEDCIDRFAPNLKPLFASDKGIRVVYARESFASDPLARRKFWIGAAGRCSALPGQTLEEQSEVSRSWKTVAMRKEAQKFYSKHKRQTWKNMISVSGSEHEHAAVQEVSFRRNGPTHENLRTKAFRLASARCISRLTEDLKDLAQTLPMLVAHNDDIDLHLSAEVQTRVALALALDIPELEPVPPELESLSPLSGIKESSPIHVWQTLHDSESDEENFSGLLAQALSVGGLSGIRGNLSEENLRRHDRAWAAA